MSNAGKPFSPACEENQAPILAILREEFADRRRVLEIGSGTGQHAVHFAAAMPHLVWQTTDRAEALAGIRTWLDEAGLPNLPPPLRLDVCRDVWPAPGWDAAFSANTTHIMAWEAVEAMFQGLGTHLAPGACFCLYGPFSYGGQHTSASNARFDHWLRIRDPASGVRDALELQRIAAGHGLRLRADHAMPTNNRLLIWDLTG